MSWPCSEVFAAFTSRYLQCCDEFDIQRTVHRDIFL